ncbi:Uncharacterised protein [Achromobacter xylosoxidans]|nr:Uncharacterised protein [Achromobacter xylosoxidans]
MRADHHAVAGGGGGDALPFGDAATHRGVGLQDAGRALVQQFLVVPAAVADLGGGDGQVRQARQLGVTVDVVGAERLLDEVWLVLLEAADVLHGLGHVLPGVVAVHHQFHVGADGLARRLQPRLFLARRQAAGLHLDGGKALGDVAGHFLAQMLRRLAVQVVTATGVGRHGLQLDRAEELVQRQAGGLGIQVPQRDVQRADRAHHRALAPLQQGLLVHRLPQPLDRVRILAQQHRRQQALHRGLEDCAAGAADVAEADAFDAVGAADLHQSVVAGRDGAVRKRGDLVQRHGGCANVDGFNDGHGWLLMRGILRVARPARLAPAQRSDAFLPPPKKQTIILNHI